MIEIDTGWQTVAAIQDLLEITLGSTQAGYVTGWKIMQSSIETITDIKKHRVQLKRASSTFTSGSGGSAVSGTAPVDATGGIASISSGQSAHGLSNVERNNTTQAVVSTGVMLAVDADAINESAGVLDVSYIPEEWRPFGPSETIILSLDEAPASCTMRALVKLLLTHG
jgi:hypothetical protein